MVIYKIITNSFILQLRKCNGVYFINILHDNGIRKYHRTTLYNTKKYTFSLFAKMASWLLTKKYISYNSK